MEDNDMGMEMTEQAQVEQPGKELIRWGDLVEWLEQWGFTEEQVRAFVGAGLIQRYYIRHHCRKSGREVRGRAFYRVRQVQEKLLRQFD